MKEKYRLELTARIVKDGLYTEQLSVNQTITIAGKDFLALCEILGKFHRLAESLDQS